jgi:hypothetical protein
MTENAGTTRAIASLQKAYKKDVDDGVLCKLTTQLRRGSVNSPYTLESILGHNL